MTLDECAGIHEAGTVDKYHIAKWPNSLAPSTSAAPTTSPTTLCSRASCSRGIAPTSTPKPADALVVHLRVGDVLEDVHLEFPVEQLLADEREVCDDLPAEGNQHRHCYIHNEHYYRRQLAKLPADYRRDTVVLVAGAHQASPAGFPRSVRTSAASRTSSAARASGALSSDWPSRLMMTCPSCRALATLFRAAEATR